MNNIDFSVVMPVRGNIDGLRITLGAFNLFTAQRDRLEIILIVDDDDDDAYFYGKLIGKYGYSLRVFVVKKSDNFSNDYYNFGAKQSIGKNILVFNDDCYIQTNLWDDIIRKQIYKSNMVNRTYFVDIFDSTRECKSLGVSFPRFPMISRKAFEAVGFFFFPQVRQWPADKCIWDLYSNVGCIIKCHDVKIQHDHNFDHANDISKQRFIKILEEDKNNGVFPVDMSEATKKLINSIEEKNA